MSLVPIGAVTFGFGSPSDEHYTATAAADVPAAPSEEEEEEGAGAGGNDRNALVDGPEIQYVFKGLVCPTSWTDQQVIDSGSYLCLKDSQVKNLTVGRRLLRYRVVIGELPDIPVA